MLKRALQEGTRYEVRYLPADLTSIVDRFNGQVLRTGIPLLESAPLCLAMNEHGLRNALRMPTVAMLDAGGAESGLVWTLMIEASR